MKYKSALNSAKTLKLFFIDRRLDLVRLCCNGDDYNNKPKVKITTNKLRDFEILLANLNLMPDNDVHVLGFVT